MTRDKAPFRKGACKGFWKMLFRKYIHITADGVSMMKSKKWCFKDHACENWKYV